MSKPTTTPFDLLPQDPDQDTGLIGVAPGTPACATALGPVISLDVMRAADAMFRRAALLSRADFSLTVPYIVKGWLFAGQTSIVYAPSNAGKTSWVLDITRAITADEDWHGYRTRKGSAVLYIAAEAPGSIYRRTVRFSDTAKDRFIVFGEPVDLVGDPLSGDKIAALAALCEQRHGLTISLVVIDTLTLCFGDGDENSTETPVGPLPPPRSPPGRREPMSCSSIIRARIVRQVREAPMPSPGTATRLSNWSRRRAKRRMWWRFSASSARRQPTRRSPSRSLP
jgi:hypothetical protein